MMYLKPSFSFPMRFSTGTLTSSKVMNVVPLAHAVHASTFDSGHRAFDDQEGNATHSRSTRAHRDGEIVGPDPVRDPLFLPGDVIKLSARIQLGLAPNVRHVTPGVRLGDAQTYDSITAQTRHTHSSSQRIASKVQNRRQTDIYT